MQEDVPLFASKNRVEGSLADTPLKTLLEPCRQYAVTGTIRVDSREGHGTLTLRAGVVEHASFGLLVGDAAVIRMGLLRDGFYELQQQAPELSGRLGRAAAFESDITRVPLATVMQHCERHALSCTLTVHSAYDRGELRYRRGELVEVGLNGVPNPDALPAIVRWPDARFKVELDPLAPEIEGWPKLGRAPTAPFVLEAPAQGSGPVDVPPVLQPLVQPARGKTRPPPPPRPGELRLERGTLPPLTREAISPLATAPAAPVPPPRAPRAGLGTSPSEAQPPTGLSATQRLPPAAPAPAPRTTRPHAAPPPPAPAAAAPAQRPRLARGSTPPPPPAEALGAPPRHPREVPVLPAAAAVATPAAPPSPPAPAAAFARPSVRLRAPTADPFAVPLPLEAPPELDLMAEPFVRPRRRRDLRVLVCGALVAGGLAAAAAALWFYARAAIVDRHHRPLVAPIGARVAAETLAAARRVNAAAPLLATAPAALVRVAALTSPPRSQVVESAPKPMVQPEKKCPSTRKAAPRGKRARRR